MNQYDVFPDLFYLHMYFFIASVIHLVYKLFASGVRRFLAPESDTSLSQRLFKVWLPLLTWTPNHYSIVVEKIENLA